jgi:uncharacterized protein (TIGR02145 family)
MKKINLLILTAVTLFSLSKVSNAQSTVKIGNQIWTAKNLDVTTYRNGDPIPQVQDKADWVKLTSGAWCYYANKTENGITYGKLYNWYAVKDSRGIAPEGFHIPSDSEWTILENTLGGKDKCGKELKSSKGWNKNGNGTNSSGFTAIPGGGRDDVGSFNYIGGFAGWWSATEAFNSGAWYRYLLRGYNIIYRSSFEKTNGFSVRCVKD